MARISHRGDRIEWLVNAVLFVRGKVVQSRVPLRSVTFAEKAMPSSNGGRGRHSHVMTSRPASIPGILEKAP